MFVPSLMNECSSVCIDEKMNLALATRKIWRRLRLILISFLVLVTCLLLSLWIVNYHSSRDPVTNAVREYSVHYFILCLIGGILASGTHFFVTPIDVIKCRMQVGDYADPITGFRHIHYHESQGRVWRTVQHLFTGWIPSMLGYCIQGGIKYSLYEIFKYLLLIKRYSSHDINIGAPQLQPSYFGSILVMFFSSFWAEFVADIALAPWEAVKIKVQTARGDTPSCATVVSRLWLTEGLSGFYKSLIPIWCRQIPSTMVKFASFEKFAAMMHFIIFSSWMMGNSCMDEVNSSDNASMKLVEKYRLTEQRSWSVELFVSLTAAIMSGLLCCIVSHPADTVLSVINNKHHVKETETGISMTVQIAHDRKEQAKRLVSLELTQTLSLLRQLGCGGIWKGLKLRLVMVVIATTMQWITYDGFKLFVGLPGTGRSPLLLKRH